LIAEIIAGAARRLAEVSRRVAKLNASNEKKPWLGSTPIRLTVCS